MPDALTDREKARIRTALGYPNVDNTFAYQLGLPYPLRIQQMFIFEDAMSAVQEPALTDVRKYLAAIEDVESSMTQTNDLFQATKVGDINPNQDVSRV